MDKPYTDHHIEKGMRIELIDMLNDPDPIPSGTKGTVTSVSDLGGINGQVVGVKWDNGRTLNVIPGVDKYKVIKNVTMNGVFREGDVSVPKSKQSDSSKKFSRNFKSTMGSNGKGLNLESSDIKKVMPIKDIAKKHGISVSEVEKEIKLGTKIELEHTKDPKQKSDKNTARRIATHHVEEFKDYYSNKKHGLIANEKDLEEEYAGGFVGPLGGKPIKKESYTIKMKDLMEVSVSSSKLRDGGSFDGSAWVGDKNSDGWNFNDKPSFHEDGEIVDILAKMDINWKDEDLTVVTKKSLKESIKKVKGNKKELLDEGKVTDFINKFLKKMVGVDGNDIKKLQQNVKKASEDISTGNIRKDKESQQNLKNVIKDIGKLTGQASFFLVPGGGISLMAAKKLIPIINEKLKLSVQDDEGVVTKKPKQDEEEDVTTETTTFSSVMGVNGMPVGKTFASTGKSSSAGKKPTWAGGTIVQSIPNEGVLMPESLTIDEVNKIKYMEGGKYVKLKNKCVKYRNQPFCSSGNADKPLVLSNTTSDNIDEVARKTGLTKEQIFKAILKEEEEWFKGRDWESDSDSEGDHLTKYMRFEKEEDIPDFVKKINSNLTLSMQNLKSLNNLEFVAGYLNLYENPIHTLGKLKHVGGNLYLNSTRIEDLGNLKYVGGNLDLRRTPMSKRYNENEIRSMVDIKGDIYL